MKQGTQSRCSGTTQRDGMGREVGRGAQDGGIHVHPWLFHVNVWQKPPQYFKIIGLQLKLKKNKIKTHTHKCCGRNLKQAETQLQFEQLIGCHYEAQFTLTMSHDILITILEVTLKELWSYYTRVQTQVS